jgi:hypothetical protein
MAQRKHSFEPRPDATWRARLTDWKQKWATRDVQEVHESIENYVYGCAVQGMKLTAIAHYFGVEKALLERAYGDVYRAGCAELQAITSANALNEFMTSKQVVGKIYMTKTWGGRPDGESDVSVDAGDSTVTINIHKAVRPDADGEGE